MEPHAAQATAHQLARLREIPVQEDQEATCVGDEKQQHVSINRLSVRSLLNVQESPISGHETEAPTADKSMAVSTETGKQGQESTTKQQTREDTERRVQTTSFGEAVVFCVDPQASNRSKESLHDSTATSQHLEAERLDREQPCREREQEHTEAQLRLHQISRRQDSQLTKTLDERATQSDPRKDLIAYTATESRPKEQDKRRRDEQLMEEAPGHMRLRQLEDVVVPAQSLQQPEAHEMSAGSRRSRRKPPPRKKTRLHEPPTNESLQPAPIVSYRGRRQASQRATAAIASRASQQEQEEEEVEEQLHTANGTEEDEEEDDQDYEDTATKARNRSRSNPKAASGSKSKFKARAKARPKVKTRGTGKARARSSAQARSPSPTGDRSIRRRNRSGQFLKQKPSVKKENDDVECVEIEEEPIEVEEEEEEGDDDVFIPDDDDSEYNEDDDEEADINMAPPVVADVVRAREDHQERSCSFCSNSRILCSLFRCVHCRRVYHAKCVVQTFSHLFDPSVKIDLQWDQVMQSSSDRRIKILRCLNCREAFRRFMEKPGFAWDCQCPTCKDPDSLLAYRRRALLALLGQADLPLPVQTPQAVSTHPDQTETHQSPEHDDVEQAEATAPPCKKQRVDMPVDTPTSKSSNTTLVESMQALQIHPNPELRVHPTQEVIGANQMEGELWNALAQSLDQVEVEVINPLTFKFPVMCSATADMQLGGKCKEGTCVWSLKSRKIRHDTAAQGHNKVKTKQKVTCGCCDKLKTTREFVRHTDPTFDAERAYDYVFVKRHDDQLRPLKPVLQSLELLQISNVEKLVDRVVQISEHRRDLDGGVIAIGRALDQTELFHTSDRLYLGVICKTRRITKLARFWFTAATNAFSKGFKEERVECACCHKDMTFQQFVEHADKWEAKEVGLYAWQSCLFVIKKKSAWRRGHDTANDDEDEMMTCDANQEKENTQTNRSSASGESRIKDFKPLVNSSSASECLTSAGAASKDRMVSVTTNAIQDKDPSLQVETPEKATTSSTSSDATEGEQSDHDFWKLWDSFDGWQEANDKAKMETCQEQLVKKRPPRPKSADDLELHAVLMDLDRKAQKNMLYGYVRHRLGTDILKDNRLL